MPAKLKIVWFLVLSAIIILIVTILRRFSDGNAVTEARIGEREDTNSNNGSPRRAEWKTRSELAMAAVYYAQRCFAKKEKHLTANGGGFGSLFQDLAASGQNAIHHGNSFDIVGHLRWYTNNTRCRKSGWRCFFISPRNSLRSADSCSNLAVHPGNFSKWELYSAMQSYMWQPNKQLLNEFSWRHKMIGMPPALPLAVALHIRRGDKITDSASKQTHKIQIRDYLDEASFYLNQRSDSNRNVYIATDTADGIQEAILWASKHDVNLFYQNQTALWQVAGREVALVGYNSEGEMRYENAVDLLFDVQQLMQAETFIGLCMSQIARMIVSVRHGRGLNGDYIAMDHWNIEHVDRTKYGVLEGWHGPVSSSSGVDGDKNGFALNYWSPPRSTMSAKETFLDESASMYSDYQLWRKPDTKHECKPLSALGTTATYDDFAWLNNDQTKRAKVTVLVQSFKAPQSLNHSLSSWISAFIGRKYVAEIIFWLNARTEADDDVILQNMRKVPGTAFRIFGNESSNAGMHYTLPFMASRSSTQAIMFLEKDWYIPRDRRASTVRGLGAAISAVTLTGVDVALLSSPLPPHAESWPCGSKDMILSCTLSRNMPWTNNPYVADRVWLINLFTSLQSRRNDPILFGCHHNFSDLGYIDIEELFHRRLLPWTHHSWIIATFLNRRHETKWGLTEDPSYPRKGLFVHRDVDGHGHSYVN